MTEAELKKAQHAYRLQCNRTRTRVDRYGLVIEMRLSFNEWLDFWLKSGKWHLRGREKGCYVMSRFNDLGHYELGNIEIKSSGANSGEATSRTNAGKPLSAQHKERVAQALTGRTFSDKHCANLAASKLGVPRDEETKAKLSAALKGKGWSEARRAAHAARKLT